MLDHIIDLEIFCLDLSGAKNMISDSDMADLVSPLYSMPSLKELRMNFNGGYHELTDKSVAYIIDCI